MTVLIKQGSASLKIALENFFGLPLRIALYRLLLLFKFERWLFLGVSTTLNKLNSKSVFAVDTISAAWGVDGISSVLQVEAVDKKNICKLLFILIVNFDQIKVLIWIQFILIRNSKYKNTLII